MRPASHACPACQAPVAPGATCAACGGIAIGSLTPRGQENTPDPNAEPNLIAGRYRLIERIGKGATGIVYRAWDATLEEEIALKVLERGSKVVDPAEVARFKREITMARKITHPNVIRIHDFGESGEDVFISMELLLGGTLSDRIRAGADPRDSKAKRFSVNEGISIATGICAGVHAAHALGIIHRDLKPENILFDDQGRPRVADFGLARLQVMSSQTMGFSGTPFYMSPEHANGLEITSRSDVYSLGVVLFQMFTGRLPFEADSFVRLVTLHCHELPPSPSTLVPSLPPELEKVILRALEKDPRARHANAGELAADLMRVAQPDDVPLLDLEALPIPELETFAKAPTTSRAQACAALDLIARRHGAAGNVLDQADALERLAAWLPAGGAEKLTMAGELLSAFDRDRAIRCWDRAVAEDPACVRALEHLVSAHEERLEWHSLLAALNLLIATYKERQSKDAASLFCKKGSVLLHHLGMTEKAKQHFRLALDVDPEHIPALQALSVVSEEEGDLEEARTWLHRLFALGATDAAERLERLDSPRVSAAVVAPSPVKPGRVGVLSAWAEPEAASGAAPAAEAPAPRAPVAPPSRAPVAPPSRAPVAPPSRAPAAPSIVKPAAAPVIAARTAPLRAPEPTPRRIGAGVWLTLLAIGAVSVAGVVIVKRQPFGETVPSPTPAATAIAELTTIALTTPEAPAASPLPEETSTVPAATPKHTPVPSATPRPAATRTPAVAVVKTPAPLPSATPAVAVPAPTKHAVAKPTPTKVAVATIVPPIRTPTPIAEPISEPIPSAFATGNELLKAGKVDEAVRELKKAVKANERYADGHFFLAAAFAAQGEDGYACDELRRYVELAPNGRYAARARTNINICE